MATELSVHLRQEDGSHFVGFDETGHVVHLDALITHRAIGTAPMELMLMSLGGSSAMDVAEILRMKHQPVETVEVSVHAERRNEHPTVFTTINLEFIVHGADVDPQAIDGAIMLSKERYCPVWAMLGQSVPITTSWRVMNDDPVLIPGD